MERPDSGNTLASAASSSKPQNQDGRRKNPYDPEQPLPKRRKVEEGGPAPPSDPNLLTSVEIRNFLRAPATLKEINLKFRPRFTQDKRNQTILTEFLRQVWVFAVYLWFVDLSFSDFFFSLQHTEFRGATPGEQRCHLKN